MPLRHDLRRGALMMLGATALFSLMGALVKGLGDSIPFPELMFFRNLLALPVVAAIGLRRKVDLRTQRFGGHFLRALAGLAAMSCSFFALTVLPLAEQTALTYSTPIFVIILSIPMLGERPGPHRWGAVLVGFLGILVIALGQGAFIGGGRHDPSIPEWLLWAGFGAAATHGLFSALTTLLVRQLSATEASAAIVLWQSILMTAMTTLALPFVWVTPSWEQLPLLIGMGLLGGLAQVMLTEAYASAQVSALGPYSYSALIWAIGIGWLVWGDVPTPSMLAGAAMIVAAGLYILHRELRRQGKPS
ncbi:DMT family transporter [Teichococcus vastitatis]|uniref:DMT family transporter n=1 Tax=Teichococcus vastitatis TaxID=2307076 RepID=A0ABS9VZR2_9PROT|nr:DMT family transporter [Pseudoroseomonas vastitatis]MCI0752502.1 DMT family transporter [Pseudoroseomonas vastitatis]